MTARKQKAPPPPAAAYTIATFCSAHHLSESFYRKIRREGWAPDEMHIGTRVLIRFEAAARWRAEREAEARKRVNRLQSDDADQSNEIARNSVG